MAIKNIGMAIVCVVLLVATSIGALAFDPANPFDYGSNGAELLLAQGSTPNTVNQNTPAHSAALVVNSNDLLLLELNCGSPVHSIEGEDPRCIAARGIVTLAPTPTTPPVTPTPVTTPVDPLQEELDRLQEEYEDLENEYDEYRRDYRDAQRDNDQRDLDRYERKLENTLDDVEDLLNDIEDLINDADDANRDTIEDDAKDLEDDAKDLESDLKNLLKDEDSSTSVSARRQSTTSTGSQASEFVQRLANTPEPANNVVVEPFTFEKPAVVEQTSSWDSIRATAWLLAGLLVFIAVVLYLIALIVSKR